MLHTVGSVRIQGNGQDKPPSALFKSPLCVFICTVLTGIYVE